MVCRPIVKSTSVSYTGRLRRRFQWSVDGDERRVPHVPVHTWVSRVTLKEEEREGSIGGRGTISVIPSSADTSTPVHIRSRILLSIPEERQGSHCPRNNEVLDVFNHSREEGKALRTV